MIVCHCRALTDRDIRQAAAEGHDTPATLARACGAGACCGGCLEAVVEVLREGTQARTREHAPLDRPAA